MKIATSEKELMHEQKGHDEKAKAVVDSRMVRPAVIKVLAARRSFFAFVKYPIERHRPIRHVENTT